MTRPIAYILTLAVVCTVVVVAQGAEAEKPVTAIQSENAELLKKAAAKVEAVRNLALDSKRAAERALANRGDPSAFTVGQFSVMAPTGTFLAERIANQCHEQWPDAPRSVMVNVRFGELHCQTYSNPALGADRVWVVGRDESEIQAWVERALDALAGKPQRTLEPEQGRGVPE